MDLEPYGFLSKELFQSIIENNITPCPNSKVSVDNVIITNPIGVGENFCSRILRSTVEYKLNENSSTNSISFIIKLLISTPTVTEVMLETLNAFPKEEIMYQSIIPELEKILQISEINVDFAPRFVS